MPIKFSTFKNNIKITNIKLFIQIIETAYYKNIYLVYINRKIGTIKISVLS